MKSKQKELEKKITALLNTLCLISLKRSLKLAIEEKKKGLTK